MKVKRKISKEKRKYITEWIKKSDLGKLRFEGYTISNEEYNNIQTGKTRIVSNELYLRNLDKNNIFLGYKTIKFKDYDEEIEYNPKESSFSIECEGEFTYYEDTDEKTKSWKTAIKKSFSEAIKTIEYSQKEKTEVYKKLGYIIRKWNMKITVYNPTYNKTYIYNDIPNKFLKKKDRK